MDWFRKFMQGRYGPDRLTYFFLFAYWPFELVGRFIGARPLEYVALVCLFTAIFRTLSKNTAVRMRENQKFMQLSHPITQWYSLTRRRIRDRKIYRYFKCTGCGQVLRVPTGKGKIKVRCSKCETTIDMKT
jgi:LSD1 subclass zinc finger protein